MVEVFSKISTTEERRSAQSVKIKCEDGILKCKDPKINSCWLHSPKWPWATVSVFDSFYMHTSERTGNI